MDKKIIKGLIDEKLEVIQEQFSIIKEYEGKIPIIELDLLMTSIRDLYELVLSLQLENIGGVKPKPAPQPETPAPAAPQSRFSSGIISMEPVITEEIPKTGSPLQEPAADIPPDFKPEVTEAAPSHPEPGPMVTTSQPVTPPLHQPPAPPEPEPASLPESESGASDPAPTTDHDQPHEKYQRITIDLFSEAAGSTLADRLKEGQEKRIADKLQENKIIDLRTTIGINDKFLFINELFDGNMRIYDEAIQKLNDCTTIAQSDLLLLDLKIVYNWDSESPTVKKFVEIVRRKF